MQTESTTRKIAILAVDGENFEVDGHYQGADRKARCYSITKVSDRSIRVENVAQFPTHQSIRDQLMN
ncbi:MAG: hypothetical protein OIF57_04270 [Marinobacterium sp.]|nr:hypothetical protein [Marinobacterium sp.]